MKELRYELMSFVKNVFQEGFGTEEQQKLNMDELRNGYGPYSELTDEERKVVLITLEGIDGEGTYDMYRLKTNEEKDLLSEGIQESIHGSFEGYSEGEKFIIEVFLQDVGYYIKEGIRHNESKK